MYSGTSPGKILRQIPRTLELIRDRSAKLSGQIWEGQTLKGFWIKSEKNSGTSPRRPLRLILVKFKDKSRNAPRASSKRNLRKKSGMNPGTSPESSEQLLNGREAYISIAYSSWRRRRRRSVSTWKGDPAKIDVQCKECIRRPATGEFRNSVYAAFQSRARENA